MYKLLIVDDEEIEREGMAHFIPWEEQGIQLVGTAWNGVQGLEMMERLRPDIVLVDVKMPVIDCLGEEFLQYVKDDMAIAVKDGGIVEVEDKNNV